MKAAEAALQEKQMLAAGSGLASTPSRPPHGPRQPDSAGAATLWGTESRGSSESGRKAKTGIGVKVV